MNQVNQNVFQSGDITVRKGEVVKQIIEVTSYPLKLYEKIKKARLNVFSITSSAYLISSLSVHTSYLRKKQMITFSASSLRSHILIEDRVMFLFLLFRKTLLIFNTKSFFGMHLFVFCSEVRNFIIYTRTRGKIY